MRARGWRLWLLALGFLSWLVRPSLAETAVDVDFPYVDGTNAYRIDFLYGESELEFGGQGVPFGGIRLRFGATARSQLELGAWGPLSDRAGILKDSDWIYGDGQPGKDIYSESDLALRGGLLARVAVLAENGRGDLAEVGYLHQRLSYRASNTRQVGYGLYASQTVSLTGPTIDYDLTCQAPYLGGRVPFAWGRGRWSFSFLYSYWLACRNLDDHLRRETEYPSGSGRTTEGKMAEGQASGALWGLGLSAEWPLSDDRLPSPLLERARLRASGRPDVRQRNTWELVGRSSEQEQPSGWRWPPGRRVWVKLAASYMEMRATGTQRQWYYYADGSTAPLADGIPMTILANQWVVSSSLVFEF